ncbi:MAG: flippase [Elainella sp. Prado103]|nr:flippase [Elainella sp. Prado103]
MGWLFASKVFRIVISLLVSTWIARYLQPDRFGTLQYALSFCSFFIPLSTVQMKPIVTRDLVRSPELADQILGTAVALQFLGGIVAVSLAIGLSTLLASGDAVTQGLVAILSLKFIFTSCQPIENWFEAKVESKFTVFASSFAFIVVTGLEILLVVSQASIWAFAVATVLETLLFALGLILSYQLEGQYVSKWRTNFRQIKRLFDESWPLLLSSTACVLYLNIDRVMLGNMIGTEEVGIYSSAATISESLSFLPLVVCSSLYPTIIRSKALDPHRYTTRLQKFYDLICGLAYGLILILFPLTTAIIVGLYGDDYRSAIPILGIYIWSCLFSFLGLAQSKWIVNEGLQKYNLYSRLAGLVANILLNLLLIPLYQGLGAAIATVISYAIGGYLYFFWIPETRANAALMTKALLLPFRLPSLLRNN